MPNNQSIWDKYEDVTEQFRRSKNSSSNQSVQSSDKSTGSIWDKYEDVSSQIGRTPSKQTSTQMPTDSASSVSLSDEWANVPEGIRVARQRDIERQNSLPEDASTFDRFKSYIGAPVTEQQYSDRNARALGAADAATLGFSDELYGGVKALPQALFGSPESFARTYADNRDTARNALRDARENNSSNYTSGSIAGTIGTAAIPFGNLARGAGLGRSVLTGAGIGATAGLGGSEANNAYGLAQDATLGAGYGAIGGALGYGAGRAVSGVANAARRGIDQLANVRNPLYSEKGIKEATNALRQEANNLYRQSEQRSVIFKPDFTKNLKNEVRDNLAEFGYSDTLHSKVNGIITEIDRLQGKNVTLKGIDNLRKQVNAVLSSKIAEPAEKAIATNINNIIDNRLGNATADEILAGNVDNARDAVGLISQARDNWRKQAKLNEVTGLLDKAERRAAASGTGGNEQNTVRQNINRILENPRGWTEAEQDIMNQIVRGSPLQNTLRIGTAFAPSTGKLQFGGLGAGLLATGGSPLVPLAAISGEAAKYGANKIADRNANSLLRTILNNGQTLEERLPALSSPVQQLIRDYLTNAGSIQSIEVNR